MNNDELTAIVQALRAIRKEQHLALKTMARALGCSISHLSMVLSGQRRPGLSFLQGTLRAYPELHSLVQQLMVSAKPYKPRRRPH